MDIALTGLAAFVMALLTIAIGVVGAVLTLIAAVASRLPPDDQREARIVRFVAGPLGCAAVGGLSFIITRVADRTAYEALDRWAVMSPILGVIAWIAIAVGLARRRKAERRRWPA